MRSWIKKLLTLTLAVLLVFSCIGCNKNNTGNEELNQWDYFSEYVNYQLYTMDETHKDYVKWQGYGVILDSYSEFSVKRNGMIDATTGKPLGSWGKNYSYFSISPTEQTHLIRLNDVAFDMVVEQDCRIKFEMYQGGKKNYIIPYEINAKASEVNRVRIKITDGWVWEQGSKIAVFLDLKNPLQVRETKYKIGNMVLDIEKK